MAQALDPSLRNKLNANKIVDDYADFANISPEQVIPTQEVEKKKRAEEETQSQQTMLNQVKEGSEIIKNIAGTDSYGNDLMARLGLI